ncbi:zinc finger, CCHC-type, retrotransposon gag domain protein [Tanacetum coccineum]
MQHFEDLVIGYFHDHARGVLTICKAYTKGVKVGCAIDSGEEAGSRWFKSNVEGYMKTLIGAFKEIGAENVDEFMPLIPKRAYGCILGIALSGGVQIEQFDAKLPGFTTRLQIEIQSRIALGGSGDQPPTLHTWMESVLEIEASNHLAPTFPGLSNKSMRGSTTDSQTDERSVVVYEEVSHVGGICWERRIVNTEFTDVAQVANAARNIEILRDRSSQNNKRNRDGDRIRPTTQDSNQCGSTTRSFKTPVQKGYPDYASSPPCDTCRKLHPGKACHRVTKACFTCGSTGHMARDFPKNGGNGDEGYGNDNQPAAKGRVFSSTKD